MNIDINQNIESLRYRGLPVFWKGDRLYVTGYAGELEWLADVGSSGRWCSYEDTSPGGDCRNWDGCAADRLTGRALAVQCLIDNGVLTFVNETPAAVSMKFIRLPAPLPWKANEILRTADVNAIYGDVSTYTVDIPAAKADAIVALLSTMNINVKSYEV